MKRKLISILLAAALIIGGVPAAVQASTQDQLDETNSQIEALEDEQAQLEETLRAYQDELSSLADELDEIVDEIDDKKAEIDETQVQIEALEASIDEKEDLIRDRAQYVYENNGSSSLEILLSSTSFGDFLNKVQFLSDLDSYDSDLVDGYNEECAQLTQMKKELESEMTLLQEMRDESEEKQDELYTLVEETNSELSSTKSELEDAEAQAEELEETLAEEIAAAQAAAQAAQAQALKDEQEAEAAAAAQESSSDSSSSDSSTKSSSSSGTSSKSSSSSDSSSSDSSYSSYSGSTYSATDEELQILAAVIYLEAGTDSAGQLAVGSVIMNRVHSSSFPNTISGVVYQTGQFTSASAIQSTISNGKYSCAMSAAQSVVAGNLTTTCLFFHAASSWTKSYGTNIGGNVFF